MRISILTLGAIASVLAMNAFAETTSSTVTSKNYVDAMDDEVFEELNSRKQNKIPASGTNSATPGDTVVTYTGTAGQIGERGIYDGSNEYDSSTDADKLVTASVMDVLLFDGPRTTVTHKTCVDWSDKNSPVDANCILWDLTDTQVIGCVASGNNPENACHTNAQCCSKMCGSGYCMGPQK